MTCCPHRHRPCPTCWWRGLTAEQRAWRRVLLWLFLIILAASANPLLGLAAAAGVGAAWFRLRRRERPGRHRTPWRVK